MKIKDKEKDLAIILVSYNTRDMTAGCIKSILDSSVDLNFDIYLVDNGSVDGTANHINKKFPDVKVMVSKNNLGFSKGNNFALRKIYKNYKSCLLLNTDTLIKKGQIEKLYKKHRESNYGILGPRLVYKDGSFQASGGCTPNPVSVFIWLSGLDDIVKPLSTFSYQQRNEKLYLKDRPIGWVMGSVMMIKQEVFGKIGFLDESLFMYGEDVEFCLRAARNNIKTGLYSGESIVHFAGGSLRTPKYSQWLGEFKGLMYIYNAYYGNFAKQILKLFIYIFLSLRIIAFFILNKKDYAENYAKIIKNL